MSIAGIGVGCFIPAGDFKTGAVGAFQNLCRVIPLAVIHTVLILQIAALQYFNAGRIGAMNHTGAIPQYVVHRLLITAIFIMVGQ